MLLKDKIALVTGGGTGVGACIAKKLAEEGSQVILVGRTLDRLETVQKEIERKGGKAQSIQADITIQREVEILKEHVLKKYGKLDILVNNAGISKEYPLLEMPIEVWDEIYDTNLRSLMILTKAFLSSMVKAKSGNIVNIGSGAAIRGLPGSIAYSVAKAGVVCFTETLGDEVRRYGIRVNVICSGPIDTEMFRQSAAREFILKAGGDVFSPETIANGVLFLASDLSEGMNSQVLIMRGFNRW